MAETETKKTINADQVVDYLRKHPDFFKKNSELLEGMTPPEVNHGGNVVDLQHHMLGRLQSGLQNARSQYENLLLSSRDNMSTLHQVHEAVLSIIRAAELERLLEVVAMDLPAYFNVDIVRLGIESEAAEFYENKFGEQNASGIAFLEAGLIDAVLGKNKSVLLVADADKQSPYGFDQVFSDCNDLVESAVMLRMRLPSTQRNVILAFGVRIKNHFHPGQGTEMLSFLAQVIEHKLDECLNDSGIAHLI